MEYFCPLLLHYWTLSTTNRAVTFVLLRLTRPEGLAPVLFVILFGEFVHADVVRHHGA